MTGGRHSGPTFRVQRGFTTVSLGGKDHFQADRDAAEQIAAYLPNIPEGPGSIAPLCRAVRYLVGEAGIRQLILLAPFPPGSYLALTQGTGRGGARSGMPLSP